MNGKIIFDGSWEGKLLEDNIEFTIVESIPCAKRSIWK